MRKTSTAAAAASVAARVESQYVPFVGGLDSSSNRIEVAPGMVLSALNYEPRLVGGYRRTGGYERFDGRARPSDASYVGMTASTTWTCSVGDTVTGASSGATGTVAYKYSDATWIAVTKITGAFTIGEQLKVGAPVVGTYSTDVSPVSALEQNAVYAACAGVYRSAIGALPGTGPVRGIAELNGTVYAWRDSGANCVVYKSTSTGWTAVPLHYELSFSAASSKPAEGSTITQGAVSATVKRVVLESGAFSGSNAAGRYIITAPSGGAFTSGALSTAGAGNVPAAGAGVYHGTAITQLAGGDYDFDVGVFTGSVRRLYGCDGVNREFEFDGDVLVPLNTGMGTTRASRVLVHHRMLWFSYLHTVQHSAIEFPYQWSALSGASEIGVNATVTNLMVVGGSQMASSMMIHTTAGAWILYGTSDTTFNLVNLSQETGADKFSGQVMEDGLTVSRNGVRLSTSTQHFDNFNYELVSNQIDGYMRARAVTASLLQRSRSLYRVFFDDGTGLAGVPRNGAMQWMPFSYGFVVRKAWRSEISGTERMFVGGDSGYVYEIDRGRSYDGAAVPATLTLHPLTAKSPWTRKTWRMADIEVDGESPFSIAVDAEFDYGDPDTLAAPLRQLDAAAVSAAWDAGNWDIGYWDGASASRVRVRTRGQSSAISLRFLSNSATEMPHVLFGASLSYTTRRLMR